MDASIGARVGAKGAGALSAVCGRIAKVKLRGHALAAVLIGAVLCSYATAQEKRPFIEKNGLVVWRFHDHWHLRKPDGILAGMVQALGWEKYQSAENPHLFTVPETTLEKLAADVAKRLNTPVLRTVGNPEMKV